MKMVSPSNPADFTHGQQIFLDDLGIANRKLVADTPRKFIKLFAVGGSARLADAAQTIGKIGHRFAVFAIHQPKSSPKVEQQIEFSVGKPGADAGRGVEMTDSFLEMEPVAGGHPLSERCESLQAQGVERMRIGFLQCKRCGIKVASCPQVAGTFNFANGQFSPRIALVNCPFLSVQHYTQPALFALLPADVAEVLEKFDGGEHQRSAHGFGAAGVVHEHLFWGHFGFAEDVRDFTAQLAVTRTEFFEPFDFNEARPRMPIELALDLLGVAPAARRTEIPDVLRFVLAEHVEDRCLCPADGDKSSGDRGWLGLVRIMSGGAHSLAVPLHLG